MKKLICLIAFICLLTNACLSETSEPTLETPSLIFDESLYEVLMDETDGSEETIYIFLDVTNDERNEIEKYGGIVGIAYALTNENTFVSVYQCLQNTEYGLVLLGGMDEPDTFRYYCCGQYQYYQVNGEYMGKAQNPYNIDTFTEAFHFPYEGPLTMLRGVRQDEDGNTYFLVKSEEDRLFEYVVGDDMLIKRISLYSLDDGSWQLYMYVDYSLGNPEEIPQYILDEIAKDNPVDASPQGQKS